MSLKAKLIKKILTSRVLVISSSGIALSLDTVGILGLMIAFTFVLVLALICSSWGIRIHAAM